MMIIPMPIAISPPMMTCIHEHNDVGAAVIRIAVFFSRLLMLVLVLAKWQAEHEGSFT